MSDTQRVILAILIIGAAIVGTLLYLDSQSAKREKCRDAGVFEYHMMDC